MDLRLIKYYLALKVIPTNDNFVDRFNGHYDFYMTPNCLDKLYIKGQPKPRNDKLTVLYCIFFSPQYEHIGYTLRTHNLLKNTYV